MTVKQKYMTVLLPASGSLMLKKLNLKGFKELDLKFQVGLVPLLIFFKDIEAVWQWRTYLKSTGILISEDYPAEIKQARRILYPVFRAT